MPDSIVLTGPASPADVADLLSGADRARALSTVGYRGIPTTELARALHDAGYVVELVTSAEEVDEVTELQGERFRLLVAPRRARARARALDLFRVERRGLAAALARTEAPLVHAQWTYEFAWAAEQSGRPWLVTAHDVPLAVLRRTRDAYRLARTAMAYRVRARTRELVAVSPYVAQAWRRQMGYRRPITIVPNIAPALEPSPGTARTAAVLAVADGGRLKNVQSLVRAAGILRTEGLDLHLRLVGPGLEDESPFAARVRAAGLAEGVVFRGPLGRADLATELSGARVFAHPSLEECCPMAVLEAMSAGLPVVAGRASGGTPWVLGHGEAGLLVDVRDAQSLAEGIRQVLVDDELARRLAGAAGRRVDQVFSTQAVVAAYAAEYYRVLGTTPRRRGETATRVFA